MKNKYYLGISTISVTLSILFFFFINNILMPILESHEWASVLIGVVAGSGFYVAIYNILMLIYDTLLVDVLNSSEAIKGEWFYKLVINPKANNYKNDGTILDDSNYRIGKCYIEKIGLRGLKMSGVHFNPKLKKFTSQFVSEFVQIDNDNIHIMYSAIGINSGLDATKGMFFLKSVGNPPKSIHGFWSDVVPSRNTGSITLMKVDKSTEEIMEGLGFPKDSSKNLTVFSDEMKFNLKDKISKSDN